MEIVCEVTFSFIGLQKRAVEKDGEPQQSDSVGEGTILSFPSTQNDVKKNCSPMVHQAALDTVAFRTLDLLRQKRQVLVTAESCTAGLISASLARVPGMSACLAGSFAVYQIASKVKWLDIPAEIILKYDVVSAEVAALMATNALKRTDHATVAFSITGHLGPDAPKALDGIAWLGYATRVSGVRSVKLNLSRESVSGPKSTEPLHIRHERQQVAVLESLGFLCDRLAEMD